MQIVNVKCVAHTVVDSAFLIFSAAVDFVLNYKNIFKTSPISPFCDIWFFLASKHE